MCLVVLHGNLDVVSEQVTTKKAYHGDHDVAEGQVRLSYANCLQAHHDKRTNNDDAYEHREQLL